MLRRVLIATTVLVLGNARPDDAQAQCVGDCDGDGSVVVAEIMSGVAIALARRPIPTCSAMDADADFGVSVSELTTAVGFALRGCPPASTPTPLSCGDPVTVARYGDCVGSENEADCVRAGGEWGPYPYSRREGCFCPTGQGGCPCRSRDDCLSFCIASIPAGGDFGDCASVEMGWCSHMSPLAGCFCAAWNANGGFGALCSDP